jgi:exopolysaccharide biosynthesis polyprenyl glycosylphosphotransferase
MKPDWHRSWRWLALGTDVLFVGGSLLLWTAARFGLGSIPGAFEARPGQGFGRAPLLYAIPVWLAVFAVLRLYNPQRCQNALEEARNLATAGLGVGVALVFLGFLVKENPARSWLLGAMALGTLSAAIGRQTARAIASRLRASGRWMTRTVVVGRWQAQAIVEVVESTKASGILPVATCGFEWKGLRAWEVGRVDEAVEATRASEVLVVSEGLERQEVSTAIEVADRKPVHVVVLPGLDYLMLSSLRLVTVINEPGLALESPVFHRYQAAIKRAIDLVVSGTLLVLTAPIMAAVAIAIKFDSAGPAIYRQERVGTGERAFQAVKFRTMKFAAEPIDPDDLPIEDLSFLTKPERDGRVTGIGYLLRRSSLDELPQLWNVFRGDMSLVGPRPLRTWEAERLRLKRRLVVKPGLTGLWQVSGRSALSAEERIRLDIVYVQNWSLLLDLSILLRTVPAVMGGKGAY